MQTGYKTNTREQPVHQLTSKMPKEHKTTNRAHHWFQSKDKKNSMTNTGQQLEHGFLRFDMENRDRRTSAKIQSNMI